MYSARGTLFLSQELECDVHTFECDNCHERFPAEETVEHMNTCPGGSSGFSERRYQYLSIPFTVHNCKMMRMN
jgi:peptide subunit release factor 1 (eRF1)